ncbi:MAG: hypothetical protein AB7F75_11745, partial [Planctomycetota bacterium]
MASPRLWLLLLAMVASCATESASPTPGGENEGDPEILMRVFDSLPYLENPQDPRYEECLQIVAKNKSHAWRAMGERLDELAETSVVRPSDRVSHDGQLQRLQTLDRYYGLRKSLIAMLSADPDPHGLALVIRHLEADWPEDVMLLERVSNREYGADTTAWTRWYLSERLMQGTPDTQMALNEYRHSTPAEKAALLKTYVSACAELTLKTMVQRESVQSLSGKVASADLEILRLQAMAVFLEALRSTLPTESNQAIIGLVELGPLATEALCGIVEKEPGSPVCQRALFVLGRSGNPDVALRIVEWASNPDIRPACLHALGNMELPAARATEIASRLATFIKPSTSPDEQAMILATMVIHGQVERFPLLLALCPENPQFSEGIESDKVK